MTEAQLEIQAPSIEQQALAIRVTDEFTCAEATGLLGVIGGMKEEAEARFRPIIARAHQTHKEALAQENIVIGPLKRGEIFLRNAIALYMRELDLRRIEEQRVAEDEAKRAQEELLEQRVIMAEARGASYEEVAAIIAQPVPIPMARYVPPPPKIAGISARINYRAEVTNMRDLCKAVAEGRLDPSYVDANMSVLNALARSSKGRANVPGVIFREDAGIARSRR